MPESRFLSSPSAELKRALTGADKAFVLQMYATERQKKDFDFEEFCNTNADLLNVSVASVRRAISQQQAQFDVQLRQATRTQAQIIAETMGATVQRAMAALEDGLTANKEKLIVHKETGEPIRDPNTGEFIYSATADHPTRVRAAAEILKVWGSYAPKQVESHLEVEHKFAARSADELLAELRATYQRIEDAGLTIDVTAKPAQLEGAEE